MLLIKPYQPCNVLSGLVDLTNSDQFYENVTKTIFFLSFSLFLILNLKLINLKLLTLFLHFTAYFLFTELMFSGGFELSIFSL